MNTIYSGSYGRLKVHSIDFLTPDFIKSLIDLEIKDIRLRLYETAYKDDIDRSTTGNTGDLNILISAINRHVIKNAVTAIFAVPPQIKPFISAYISKWDIESIKAIINSKFIKHEIKYDDSFIISFRDIPLGIFAGNLKQEDFKSMLSKNDIDSLVNYLLNYGYNFLLKYLDDYKKTGDISGMLSSFDYHYYTELADTLKYFNGDEGALINYIKTTIDLKNILTMVKSMELNVPYEKIEGMLIENGSMSKNFLTDLFRSKNSVELLNVFKSFNIEDAIEYYKNNKNLSMFEISMRRSIYDKYVPLMLRDTATLYIMGYILTAERERDNLRTIIIGKSYNLDKNIIEKMLI